MRLTRTTILAGAAALLAAGTAARNKAMNRARVAWGNQ